MEVKVKERYRELVENIREVKRRRAKRIRDKSRRHFDERVKKWLIP